MRGSVAVSRGAPSMAHAYIAAGPEHVTQYSAPVAGAAAASASKVPSKHSSGLRRLNTDTFFTVSTHSRTLATLNTGYTENWHTRRLAGRHPLNSANTGNPGATLQSWSSSATIEVHAVTYSAAMAKARGPLDYRSAPDLDRDRGHIVKASASARRSCPLQLAARAWGRWRLYRDRCGLALGQSGLYTEVRCDLELWPRG